MNFINLYVDNNEKVEFEPITYNWINVDKISVSPFYNISSALDTDTFIVNYNSTGTQTLTLTNGLYETLDDLRAEVETQLQTIDVGFTATYSSITKKITMTHSTNSFTYSFGVGNLYLLLGFSQDNVVANSTFTAGEMMNLRPFSLILLNITGVGLEALNYFDGQKYTGSIFVSNKYISQPSTDYYTFDNSTTEFEGAGKRNKKKISFNSIRLKVFIGMSNNEIKSYSGEKKCFVRLAYY